MTNTPKPFDPDRDAYFMDPDPSAEDPVFGPDEKEDVHGQDLIGADEDGLWWGTDRACWVLSPGGQHVTVYGRSGANTYEAHFLATEEEAREWCLDRRIDVTEVC